jgi:hypothetical protein
MLDRKAIAAAGLLAALSVAISAVGAAPPPDATPDDPDTLVVGPRQFLDALKPWVAHRTQQGHKLGFVSSEFSADEIREAIRESARSGKLRTVVILGDAEPVRDAKVRARCTPTHHVRAKVNVQWGSEPEIATDNWYADLNGDDVPDLAIGRIPADSPEELRTIVGKILAYERSNDFGIWRRRINFVAGVGGFGAVTDALLETATKKFLTDGIPAGYATTMTYGSWQSPYCPDPRYFREASLERLNEGCLFWVYIGHGQKTELDRIRVPGRTYAILSNNDMPLVAAQAGSPVAVFLACYTAAFDQPRDCLAEELLRAPKGPVAVLGGTRVTMPYAMSILGTNLMNECFQEQVETLGEMILNAKRGLIRPDDSLNRKFIDLAASLLSPSGDQLEAERIEHLHLFNLIGDPLLRIRAPLQVEMPDLPDTLAGSKISLQCRSPIAGRCIVELTCRRDRLRFAPPERLEYVGSDEELAGYADTYQQANQHQWTTLELDVPQGPFSVELAVPPEVSGANHIRVFVQGERSHAIGTTAIFVETPPVVTSKSHSQR